MEHLRGLRGKKIEGRILGCENRQITRFLSFSSGARGQWVLGLLLWGCHNCLCLVLVPWVNCDLPPSHLAVSHRVSGHTDCLLSCPRACPLRAMSVTKTVLSFHMGACRGLRPLLQKHFPEDPLGPSALCLLLLSGSFYPAVNSASCQGSHLGRPPLALPPSGSAVELCVAPVLP